MNSLSQRTYQRQLQVPLQAEANDKIVSTSASEHDSSTSVSEYRPEPPTKRRALRSSTKKEEIITPEMVSAMDRCGMSDQKSMIMIPTTLKFPGQQRYGNAVNIIGLLLKVRFGKP